MKIKPYPITIVSSDEHQFDYDVFVAMELTDTHPYMNILGRKIMENKHFQKKPWPFIWYGEYLMELCVTPTYKAWTKTLSNKHQELLFRRTKFYGANFNKHIKVNDDDLVFTHPIQIFVFMQHNNLHTLGIGGLHIIGCINDFNNELQHLCEEFNHPIECIVIKDVAV
jgi:hypothetical protein